MKTTLVNDPSSIFLGKGIFRIDGNVFGATQGGGKFTLEREYRSTAVDGAKGTLKGLTYNEGSTPKLEISNLEVINDDFIKRHPALQVSTTDDKKVITGRDEIKEDDYHTVEFVGHTKSGKEVIIKVENAINLENIEFDLKEKSEVIDTCTFTGTYPIDCESDYEPWNITYPVDPSPATANEEGAKS